MRKKILAMFITVCMVVTMVPSMAFAASDDNYVPKSDSAVQTQDKGTESSGDKAEPTPAAAPTDYSAEVDKATSEKTSPKGSSAAATVGGNQYYSVQGAIDAANAGDTVTLLDYCYESLYIDKGITLDLNGFGVLTEDTTDAITVDAYYVEILNGLVVNLNYYPKDHATAVYVAPSSSVVLDNVGAMTVGGSAVNQISSSYYVANGSTAELYNCGVFYDTEYVSSSSWINGAYVEESGELYAYNCDFKVLYGDCCYVNGDAVFEKCYFTAEEDSSAALDMGPSADTVLVASGYFYGDPAVWIDYDCYGDLLVLEGEFHSAYTDYTAVSGNTSCLSIYKYNGQNTISSPTNWKNSNHFFVYEGVNAPTTASINLTPVNGVNAGYDDIKFTWGKSTGADGYRVNYKKGTGSYTGAKYYKSTATRTRTVANLDDGYKYTFKVTPYVLVNEDILSDGGTKCYSNKIKTAYTYTLKKVTLSTFSKSNGKVKVAWKNISGETGYQISQSTSKSKTKIVATYKTTTGKTKLVTATKGKTYWYKVRAYKEVNGKKIYGPWSAPKSYRR